MHRGDPQFHLPDCFYLDILQVNSGLLRLDEVVPIPYTNITLPFNDTYIEIGQYFDDRYGSITPIYCFSINGRSVCLMNVGSIFVYPIFNHFGNAYGDPKKCDW